MSLPILLGLAGGLGGAALGCYAGVKAGSKLDATLTDDEKDSFNDALSAVGIAPKKRPARLPRPKKAVVLDDPEDGVLEEDITDDPDA